MRMAEAAVVVELGLSKRQSKKVPVEAKRPIKVASHQLHLDQPSSHVYFLRVLDPASAPWCSRRSRLTARWYWLDRIAAGCVAPCCRADPDFAAHNLVLANLRAPPSALDQSQLCVVPDASRGSGRPCRVVVCPPRHRLRRRHVASALTSL